MLQELGDALQAAKWDDDIAVVGNTYTGTKAFCTRIDIKEWNDDWTWKD
jgi:enoyl-CoA hydratase/carnithine racemase